MSLVQCMHQHHDHAHHDHNHAQTTGCTSPLLSHESSDAVCVDQVTFHYDRSTRPATAFEQQPDQPTLDAVTLHVPHGQSVGIVGPNGAGKTTLVKLILGLLEPDDGRIAIEGLTPREACRQGGVIGYLPQRHDVVWNFPLSVRQVVGMGLTAQLGWLSPLRREHRQRVDEVMEQVGVTSLAGKPIGSLSGGQQQRVFLARALAVHPKVLVLDEPMNGIDVAGRESFSQLLSELHHQRTYTMLMVSHDLQAVVGGCDSVAVLRRRIHYHDAPDGLTREVLMEVFEHDIIGEIGS